MASDVRRPRSGRNASVGVMLGCCDGVGSFRSVRTAVEAVVDGGANRSGVTGGVARNVLVLATMGGAGRRLIWEMLWP